MDQPLKDKNSGKLPLAGSKELLRRGQARILVAPLDWGLGHATRCIPIIRELIRQDAEVWLAGEGAQEQLLRTEFPRLQFLNLPGYRIKYAKTAGGLLWKMIRQGPKMQKAIRHEYDWLKKANEQYHFDAVISDNRYGLYHKNIHCVFMTHQLHIKSAAGKWTERILQQKNYQYINRFTECWVPDLPGEPGLAGELSQPRQFPAIPVKYIGLLSRFSKKELPEKKDHLLILFSGPEPQRTIFEDLVIEQVSQYNGTATIVRGLPGSSNLVPSTNMIKFYNHLPAEQLNVEMQQAAYIISRSGYSTIMDAVTLQKKCIFIPTPGQTEQEYLGNYLMKKRAAFTVAQKGFSLENALKDATGFDYKIPPLTEAFYRDAITDLLQLSIAKRGG